jgi:hypothetical protein
LQKQSPNLSYTSDTLKEYFHLANCLEEVGREFLDMLHDIDLGGFYTAASGVISFIQAHFAALDRKESWSNKDRCAPRKGQEEEFVYQGKQGGWLPRLDDKVSTSPTRQKTNIFTTKHTPKTNALIGGVGWAVYLVTRGYPLSLGDWSNINPLRSKDDETAYYNNDNKEKWLALMEKDCDLLAKVPKCTQTTLTATTTNHYTHSRFWCCACTHALTQMTYGDIHTTVYSYRRYILYHRWWKCTASTRWQPTLS